MAFKPEIKDDYLYQQHKAEQQQALWYYGLGEYGKFLTSPKNVNLVNTKLIDLIEDQHEISIPLQDTQDIREDIMRLYLDNKAEIELDWVKLGKEELENEIIKFNMRVVGRLMTYIELDIYRKKEWVRKWNFEKRVPKVKRATDGAIIFYEEMHPEVMGRKVKTHLS